jgi:Zn-dependent protease
MEQFLVNIVVVLVVILVSVILHELMHGVVAYWLGDTTARDSGRLSLNPLRHLDWFMSLLLPLILAISGAPIFGGAKPVPIDGRRLKGGEWGFALVAIAGPLTNFVLALIGYAVLRYFGADWTGLPLMVASQFVMVNLGFMIFNLLPIPPLDGSRVLYALAPEFVRKLMMRMEQFGIVIVLMLVLLFSNVLGQVMMGAMKGVLAFFEILMP